MVSLAVLVMFLLVVAGGARACLRLTERSLPRGGRRREAIGRAGRVELPNPAPPAVETPLEALQRRFAEGKIGMEQYEQEVGRLFGLKSLGQG